VDRCYFAKDAPDIEVRNGLVFIRPKDGHCEIALAPTTLAAFVAIANRALDELYERRSAGIIPIRGVG
jgi:hypothetical protein